MINPRIDTLLEHVDSNYASVLVAAKRARQINSYYHNLGEGTFDEFPPPMVESGSKNYLTIALELVGEDRRAGERREGRGADEPLRRRGLDDPDRMPRLRRQAHELERLVGGDPPGDTEQDSGQLPSSPGTGPTSGSGT